MDDKRKNSSITERQGQGNDSSNYKPVTGLPLAWKILTGILAEEIYSFFDENMKK